MQSQQTEPISRLKVESLQESDMPLTEKNRMPRKEAVGMETLISEYIRQMKLTSGLNCHRVFAAWDEVSGVSRYTVDRFFKDGVLYVTMNSSMVRNQLYFQLDVLMDKMNAFLEDDFLFDGAGKEGRYIKKIVLR